ncbi:LANO_0F15962g1_1 [Lachancea nothofagi CBS 11611]|uniref:Calcium-channel protein CCH1 n=1 Tax=Lachancea nothofagi CBS 11611 TaxID=1266666 RepID=A0A1G4KCW0_9SACH|nr:LANO_0F15962g1_1 [Lachancea nothofagi CBS 11611]
MASRRDLTQGNSSKKEKPLQQLGETPILVKVDRAETDEDLYKANIKLQGHEGVSKDDEIENKPTKRPNLTVLTQNFGSSSANKASGTSQLSTTSIRSHLKNLISPSRALDSEINNELRPPSDTDDHLAPHEKRFSLTSGVSGDDDNGDNLRSANIISTIDEGDLSDFKDLQDEFENAMQKGSSTWLPQTKSYNDEAQYRESRTSSTQGEVNQHSRSPSRSRSNNRSPSPFKARETNSQSHQTAPAPLSTSPSVQTVKKVAFGSSEEYEEQIVSDSSETGSDSEVSHNERPTQPSLVLCGKSLGIFPPNNRYRLKMASLVMSKWTARFKVFLSISMVVLLCVSFEGMDGSIAYTSSSKGGLLFAINILYTFEISAQIFAFGFWDDSQLFHARGEEYRTLLQILGFAKFYDNLESKYGSVFMRRIFPFDIKGYALAGKTADKQLKSSVTFVGTPGELQADIPLYRAYARSSWNRVEFISTACFWVSLLLSINDYDAKHGVLIFKTLATLRILKLATGEDSSQSPVLKSVKYGLPQLINVCFMLLYFWILFGILGVQSFQGSLRRQCVWTNPDDATETYENSMQFCGGHLQPGTKKPMPYVFSDGRDGPLAKGFLCPQNSKCVSNQNPHNGRVNFDNILSSMELVFVTISANTFTDIMYYTMDSDSMAASLFFISCIFFLNIWMINLMIAVLVSSFEKANEMWRKGVKKNNPKPSRFKRIVTTVTRYVLKKANSRDLPNKSKECIKWYKKSEFLFVMVISADLIMQSTISSDSTENDIKNTLIFDRVTTYILLFECVIRFLCYSPNLWKILTKPNYIFDLLTCIVSVVITVPTIRERLGQNYYWLNIFHVVRFYRVITMIKVTRNLWKQVLGNALLIWDLSGFYFFFLFLVSIIVSVYFSGTVPASQIDENPYAIYNISTAFLTLFIIGSTENWTESLYTLQEYAPNYSSQFFGSVLLIMWFFLAYFVMMNIFIAIIAESLDVPEEEKRPLQIKHYLKHVYPEKIKEFTSATLVRRIKNKIFKNYTGDDSRDFRQFLFRGTAIVSIAQQHNILDFSASTENNRENPGKTFLARKFKRLSIVKSFTKNPFYRKPEVIYIESTDSVGLNKKYTLKLNDFEEDKLQYMNKHPFYNNSYFIFPPNHIFRRFCQSLTPPSVGKRTDGYRFFEDSTNIYGRNSHFRHIKRDLFVALITVLTVLMVAYSCSITPLYRMKHTSVHRWSVYFDAVFATIFSLEFVIKTVADGLVHTPNAYLRNPWNCIDVTVLISIWINFIASLRGDDDLSRVFKGLTALRALRCLTISKTARSTFNQVLFDGIGKIIGAATVSMTLLFPFAVWGLGIFRGRLGTCNDSVDMSRCYNEFSNEVYDWDVLMPRVYSEPYLYMNSFSSAFRSLYEIVSLEGWVDILGNSMASTGVGTLPRTFATPQNGFFFVLFNFLSMIFILTLFVTFIMRNHARRTGSAFLTIEEKSWLEVKRLLSQVRPEPTPEVLNMSRIRVFCYRLAVEKAYFWYTLFLQAVLYLHILTLLLYTYRETNPLETYQNVVFMISTTVFLCQEILYITGKGIKLWLARKWDVFKCFVVLTSFCFNIVQYLVPGNKVGITNVRDLFQLVIFLFVIPQSDVLSELISTAMASMPSILSLTYTWGILFLVYAIALNQIFGLTKLGPNTTGNLNFRTVTKSLIVLFRCSFGEGWNYIMVDLTVTSPFCYVDTTSGLSDCGSKPYAYVLLMSWNILSMYIFLNMFVSLVLENFSYLYHAGSGFKSVASRDEIRRFKNAWKKLDPDGIGEIEHNHLPRLMRSFDGLLSFKIWEGRLSVKNLVENYMTVNPQDPYDVNVDIEGLNNELQSVDRVKIIERKQQYRRFIQEARALSAFKNGVSFSKLIQQIPMYTTYSPQECLGIDEYVKRLYVMGKVDRFLENERNVDVLEMMVTRWKFLYEKRRLRTKGRSKAQQRQSDIPNVTITNSDQPGTPRLDFSVNNFNWSPRRGGIQEQSDSLNASFGNHDSDDANRGIYQ